MKFAFCFLTYRNILHPTEWSPYFQNNNIYIHPKQREYISDEYRSFVIPNIINTSWGDRSIVDATVLLLEQAMTDNDNQWFILCSEDSCPLKPYLEFLNFFEKQSTSIFNVMDNSKNKTSQWWALCRADVELLLKNKSRFSNVFENINKRYRKQAVDELFFLNALKQFKSNYLFKNGCVHYVKWFAEWTSKHPTAFNRLLEDDVHNINNNSCWFIRKTFSTFENKLIDKKPNCIIMCVGSESTGTYDKFFDYFSDSANIFLLVMDPTKLIEQSILREKSEQTFYVVWNMVDKAMEVLYNKFSSTYDSVIILKEKYNYSEIIYPTDTTNSIDFLKSVGEIYSLPNNLPTPAIPILPLSQSITPTTKIPLREHNRNYKIAFLFLVIEDINYPNIWANYFNRNGHNINIYCHAKYPERTRTEWLSRNMVRNIRPTSWGNIVDAYFSLFDAAVQNPDNMRFITISESCLPIYSLNAFFNMLDRDDFRTSYVHFMKPTPYDISARIQNQRGYERFGEFTKHYARFCLSRYHLQKLLICDPNDIQFFKKMHVGDEFFLTLIHAREGNDFIKQSTITYDNWEDVKKEANAIKNEIDRIKIEYQHMSEQEYNNAKREVDQLTTKMNNLRKNPKTYYEITNYDVNRAFNSGAFFWRKFPPILRDISKYYNRDGTLFIPRGRYGGKTRRRLLKKDASKSRKSKTIKSKTIKSKIRKTQYKRKI